MASVTSVGATKAGGWTSGVQPAGQISDADPIDDRGDWIHSWHESFTMEFSLDSGSSAEYAIRDHEAPTFSRWETASGSLGDPDFVGDSVELTRFSD